MASERKKEVHEVKKLLKSEFDMKDLGAAKKILGMPITRNRDENSFLLFRRITWRR